MAWNGLGVISMSAASPGGVGWVFIPTLHKLAIAVEKLAVMTYIGVALPQLPETTHVSSQKTP